MTGPIQDYKLLKRRQEISTSLDVHLKMENSLEALKSETPTRSLILLNAGYTGGSGSIEPQAIQDLFCRFNVLRVIMPLSKPYSFLVFPSEKESWAAVLALDQTLQWDRPIMLECIHELPPNLYDPVLTRPEEINGCIPGLHYFPDFISSAEEARILEGIASTEWIPLHYRKVV